MSGRRRFLGNALAGLLFAPAFARAATPSREPFASDFDALWREIDAGYAYFTRATDWKAARARWRPNAAAARTRDEFIAALEGALAELRDEHVTLSAHRSLSTRPVPTDTDVWARWIEASAVITAVRAGSVSDSVGLRPGLTVSAIDGVPVERAVRGQLPKALREDAHARDWALRRLLAGPWSGLLRIEARLPGGPRRFDIERSDVRPASLPPLIARRIGENRDVGYLRIKNNLADPGLVAHFDAALDYLRDTRGLLLDLRETQAGGAPAVARALLGRFTDRDSPWIVRVPRSGARPGTGQAAERVAPRGPFSYRAPVAALVDRWTAGEGESLAVGLQAVARATLIGTPMAGLQGDTREVHLRNSGISARFPAARVFLVDGTPREAARPALPVDVAAPSGGPGDPILYQGLKFFA
jgi:carboxyl-terminal processing protease